ncbi:Ionotropic receptor 255 [Frankliniella occidentalis]|nr:Ionotropic receptor 255 [Frankliniella occidentalis]
MSTHNTALSALFLWLALGEASSNTVSVLTSRVERDHKPEVLCALTLIPPLFQRTSIDSATYAPRLFVFGKANWLGEFLRLFPSVASIYVFNPAAGNITKFDDFLLVKTTPSTTIVLNLTGGALIPVPFLVRYIFWESFDSNAKADDKIKRGLFDTCHRLFRWLVTARPRGTTHVFSMAMPCDYNIGSDRSKAELLGVWSPAAGWRVPLFPALCSSWRPPPDGEPLLAEMFEYANNSTATLYNYVRSEAYEVLRLLRDSYGLEFQIKFNSTSQYFAPLRAAETCRLDVLAFPAKILGIETESHSELSIFPWEDDYHIVVVPVGAGKPAPLLYPVTAEYTPAVWAALGAVVLVVVACLYLMRRDESVQELVLQTMLPLLGQPLDARRKGPQVAILGGWLLTCLVVVNGYQGQLLGFITVPPQNGEIDSWQDWLESDLLLLVNKNFDVSAAVLYGCYGLRENRILRAHSNINHLDIIATQKNASILISKYNYDILIRDKWAKSENNTEELLSKIHTFVAPLRPTPKSSFLTTKGSPFEVPLRKVLGRIRAAGGLRTKQIYRTHLLQTRKDKPISLINIMPVIAAFIAGNIFALFTFLFEFFLPYLK